MCILCCKVYAPALASSDLTFIDKISLALFVQIEHLLL